MSKKKILEGKTKKVYQAESESELILEFKNDYPIGKKGEKLTIKEKGAINNQVSSILFKYIGSYHVPTHFKSQVSKREMLVKKLDMLPLQIMARNIATGSLVKRYGLEKGKELDCPVIEFYLKSEKAEETLINRDHIVSFGYASSDELKDIHRMVSKINVVLRDFFRRRHYKLADFVVEFGRMKDELIVGDELSLDTMSLLDLENGQMIEKDQMGKDAAHISAIYKSFYERVL